MPVKVINRKELKDAGRFFERAIVATKPEWVREARLILWLRSEGNSFGKIAKILTRNVGEKYNYQTVYNRLQWALKIYYNR